MLSVVNIADQLPAPLNSFVIDIQANDYYDFELPVGSDYPLPGVTYPVDYGHILGYTSEDGHELDLFAGQTSDGLVGSIKVFRGKDRPDEHKFYVALHPEELAGILSELKPVLLKHSPLQNLDDLLLEVEKYKDET